MYFMNKGVIPEYSNTVKKNLKNMVRTQTIGQTLTRTSMFDK